MAIPRVAEAPSPYIKRLAKAYTALAEGLLYPGSEGDSPYKWFATPFGIADELDDPAALRRALSLAIWWEVAIRSGDDWFTRTLSLVAGDDDETHEQYQLLWSVMRETTVGDLFHLVVSAPSDMPFHRTRHYIGGRVPGGGLAGVVTLSVET